MQRYKKIRLPGGRNTEGNLRGFTVVGCCEIAYLQSVSLCMFLYCSLGKHIYLDSALIHFW